ncbi:hypothetical protein F5Y01DRAFT_130340 [Xylaria sp. FL0043]|nr:hypothetical protein F5Y01DRAFT_130340 [Xylaria sp. FL0043]
MNIEDVKWRWSASHIIVFVAMHLAWRFFAAYRWPRSTCESLDAVYYVPRRCLQLTLFFHPYVLLCSIHAVSFRPSRLCCYALCNPPTWNWAVMLCLENLKSRCPLLTDNNAVAAGVTVAQRAAGEARCFFETTMQTQASAIIIRDNKPTMTHSYSQFRWCAVYMLESSHSESRMSNHGLSCLLSRSDVRLLSAEPAPLLFIGLETCTSFPIINRPLPPHLRASPMIGRVDMVSKDNPPDRPPGPV